MTKDNFTYWTSYYEEDYFNMKKIKKAGIDSTECFEYKRCVAFRRQRLRDLLEPGILVALTILTFAFAVALLFVVLKNLRKQIKVNRKSFILLLKISMLIFIQSLILLVIGVMQAFITFYEWGENEFLNGFYLVCLNVDLIYSFYIVIDALLILFILSEYRENLLFFVPKIKKKVGGTGSLMKSDRD